MNTDTNSSNYAEATFCHYLPPIVNSRGLWDRIMSPLGYPLPLLQLQMLSIFLVTEAVHYVLKNLGQPKIVSQMIAGLILGPTGFGSNNEFEAKLFSIDSQTIIGTLAVYGYTLFMFLIGVKMDVTMIRKTGRKAFAIGILALLGPLMAGAICSFILAPHMEEGISVDYLPYLIATHSLTSFPVISCLLGDLKLLNSEIGRLALSAAIITDLFSILLVTVGTMAKTAKDVSFVLSALEIITTAGFLTGAVFIFRPAMFWVIKRTPQGRPVDDGYIITIIFGVLLSGLISNQFGQFVIFGPFILGLVVPDGPPLGSTLVGKLDYIVSGLLLPIFVTTCTLRTDLFSIHFDGSQVWINIILVVVTFMTKFVTSIISPLYCKLPFGDAATVALIMSCKGVVELATYSFMRDYEVINQETFAVMSISTLAAASIVPFLVKNLYDPSKKYGGYEKRNVMHWRPDSELRILACIHRSDSIAAMINLLDALSPRRDSPIAIYVLHLIELVGRASPIFISHKIQKRIVSNSSYSENVLVAFGNYERNKPGVVAVQAFTAISPTKLMHEDICTLALNKLAYLIIIPFDLKWAIDGSVESENQTIRKEISNVLNRAPCSVAILVDRGHLGQSTSLVSIQSAYCVAMLFFGGNDDREALACAKCMARDESVRLTVVHFIVAEDEEDEETITVDSSWEKMLDDMALKDVKKNNFENRNVIYMEEKVKDGPETALVVRSIVDEYDLIIVGRRYNVMCTLTSGLSEWCEYEELGIIGDLLSSADLESKTSVLVVQQQQQSR